MVIEYGVKSVLIADSPGGAVSRMPDFNFSDFYKKAGYAYLDDIPGVVLNTDIG
ncbi:MAG: hypothetical protein IJL25_08895 [Clostridia bacterium]|nr:hypothetical protein [Clostridia bacterium]MBR5423110.1 hypothetical protein [Clostridia bacterium]